MKKKGSDLELALWFQVRCARLPAPILEYEFARPRRWRFDAAWPDRLVAVEVEGGTWVYGAHSRGAGMHDDMEKYNVAALRGWRVLRFDTVMIRDGTALATIEEALK